MFIRQCQILNVILETIIKNYCQLRYGEESHYDYKTGKSKNGEDIGHFTQVVWKGSTKFGIAKASAKQKNGWYGVYVVAQYSPAGNSPRYIANVGQPGK